MSVSDEQQQERHVQQEMLQEKVLEPSGISWFLNTGALTFKLPQTVTQKKAHGNNPLN